MSDFIPRSYYYRVTIDGTQLAFSEVSGLQTEVATEEVSVGGYNHTTFKLPLRIKHSNLVLKRAFNINLDNSNKISNHDAFYQKWGKMLTGENPIDIFFGINYLIKSILIELMDPEGSKTLMSWNISDAYPVKWQLSNLSGKENSLAIESIEFVYTSLKLKSS